MDSTFLILLLISLIVGGFAIWFYFFKIKHLKLPNVYLVTGGVKTGKSFVSVALAVKTYKKELFLWKLKRPFWKLLKKEIPLEPMLYSNMKLRNVKHNLLSMDIVKRKVRIPNKSVVLIDEVSLLADSMLFNDRLVNEQLMLFVKLFGHYTHGGTLIVNTQALADCHYSFKRCLSSYLWIHNKRKHLFFTLFDVRELTHSEDNDIINNIERDNELDTRPLFFLNKYYKYYDCYCYSCFTDDLDYKVNYDNEILTKHDSLKTHYILSLQNFQTINVLEEVKPNEKKESA